MYEINDKETTVGIMKMTLMEVFSLTLKEMIDADRKTNTTKFEFKDVVFEINAMIKGDD